MIGKIWEVIVKLARDLVVFLEPPVLAVDRILFSPQMLQFLFRFVPCSPQDVGQRDCSERCDSKAIA